jgi:hypothetical protein
MIPVYTASTQEEKAGSCFNTNLPVYVARRIICEEPDSYFIYTTEPINQLFLYYGYHNPVEGYRAIPVASLGPEEYRKYFTRVEVEDEVCPVFTACAKGGE